MDRLLEVVARWEGNVRWEHTVAVCVDARQLDVNSTVVPWCCGYVMLRWLGTTPHRRPPCAAGRFEGIFLAPNWCSSWTPVFGRDEYLMECSETMIW